MHAAEARAGTGHVAALDAASAHVLAAVGLIVFDEVVLGDLGQVAQDAGHHGLVLDVDVHAGEAGGQAGVLALLANGQGQLVVGHDDGRVVVVVVDDHARHAGRRKRAGHALCGVVVPKDDVHALAAQLRDHGANAAALGANAGAHGIQVIVVGRDGDLGAHARLAGDGADLDDAVVDLGDLDLKEATEQVGVGAGDHDGGTLALAANDGLGVVGVTHADDQGLDALVVQVALGDGALVELVGVTALVKVGQLGLDALADLDDREIGRSLQDGAGDDVAHALSELLVDLHTAGVAHDGADLGLGVLGSDAGGSGRGDVDLLELGVIASLGVLLAHGHKLVDVDTAGGAVNGHAGAKGKVQDVGVAFGQRLLKAVDQVELVDVLFLAEKLKGFHHIGRHMGFSSLFVLLGAQLREVGLQGAFLDLVKGDGDLLAVAVELDGAVLDAQKDTGEAATTLDSKGSQGHGFAGKAGKIGLTAKRAVEARRAHLKGVGGREGVDLVDRGRNPLGLGSDLVERDGLSRGVGVVDAHADAGVLGGAHDLDRDNVDAVLGAGLLELIYDDLLGRLFGHVTSHHL